jgi:hypothetical protein
MKTIILLVFVTISLITAAETAVLAQQDKKQRHYAAPDGGVSVVVVPVSKEAGRSEYESRIEFKSRTARLLAPLIIPRKITNTVSES